MILKIARGKITNFLGLRYQILHKLKTSYKTIFETQTWFPCPIAEFSYLSFTTLSIKADVIQVSQSFSIWSIWVTQVMSPLLTFWIGDKVELKIHFKDCWRHSNSKFTFHLIETGITLLQTFVAEKQTWKHKLETFMGL